MHRLALQAALFATLTLQVAVAAQSTSSTSPGKVTPSAHSQAAVSDQVGEAETAIAATDWKTAEAKLDPWLAAHPNDARALFDAGYVADVQNRDSDAESLYRRSISADENQFDPCLLLGMLLARDGKLADARTQLQHATQLDPGEGGPELKARAWRALSRLDRDTDPAAASNDLLEALKLTPETTDDMLMAADLAVKAGQMDAAEAEYRRVLAKDANSEPANAGLAHILIKKKAYPEAETLLRAALEKVPDDPALNAQLAAVLAAQDKAEALPLLQKLHGAHPDDVPISRMLAEVLADAGDYDGSDDLYVKLLVGAPDDSDLLVGHAENLVHKSLYMAAFKAYDKATKINPKNADGWSGLAFVALQIAEPDVTVHALAMRSQLMPETASTYFLRATAYDSMSDRTHAAAYYHSFLDASAGKFPTQEAVAKQRLKLLEK